MRRWKAGLAPLLVYGAALAFADPRGAFCLNDDFSFANPVRAWLETGRLRLLEWSLPANITHIACGAAAGTLFGPTNQNLRLANIVVGAAAVLVFFVFLTDLGVSLAAAAAAAAVLAANPLFLAMAASFHADVNSLLLQVLALWLFLAHVRSRRLGPLALSSAVFGLAALNRQAAIVTLAGGAAYLLRSKRLSARAAAAFLLPGGLIFAAYLLWFCFDHGLTWAWRARKQAAHLDPALFREALLRMNASVQTAAVFLSPLVIGFLPAFRRHAPGRKEAAALAGVAALAVWGWLASGGMPELGNTISRLGLGVVVLNDPEQKTAGLWRAPSCWFAVALLGLVSSLALTRLLFQPARKREENGALLWVVLPSFLILLTLPAFFDRYLLIVLPALIACAVLEFDERAFSPAACLAGCAVLATLSSVGLRDYFAWNRARWDAGAYGLSLGLTPRQIENGFDWDGQFTLQENMEKLLARKAPQDIDVWDWQKENPIVLLTSFSPRPPREDFKPIRRFAYKTPLADQEEFVYLYGWGPALKPR